MTPTKPRYPLLTDNEMDDIATKKQLASLDWAIEEYQASKRQQASQPSQDTTKPNNES